MQAMGAIDAYGGRIVPEEPYRPSLHPHDPSSSTSSRTSSQNHLYNNNKTPSVYPQISVPFSSHPTRSDEPEPDTDTETEAGETETEGGWTTDDEPTIRPGHSSTESESDCASLCSTGTEEGDFGDEEEESREVEIEGEGEGREERTPEQRGKNESDIAMASP